MKSINRISTQLLLGLEYKLRCLRKDERGDVPGWVLVTVMTAGLVVALWSIADGQLKSVLENAIRSVSSP